MTQPNELETAKFIDPIVDYCSSKFPKPCTSCGRNFESFADFVAHTVPVGSPQAYDTLEEVLENVGHPIGALSFVNCVCGTTLTVECGDTESDMYLALLEALERDIDETGWPASDVLTTLRNEIRARVAQRAEPHP
jgi:hypothetical protein